MIRLLLVIVVLMLVVSVCQARPVGTIESSDDGIWFDVPHIWRMFSIDWLGGLWRVYGWLKPPPAWDW